MLNTLKVEKGLVCKKYLISGRVQGVGFRYFTQKAAAELNIQGWVRNLPSGDVESKAWGSKEILKELESRLWKGPALSKVTNIKISEENDFQPPQNFNITYS